MQIATKKLKNGFELPEYGLGTWQMGGRREHDPNNDDERDIQAIKDAIAHGITHIDTAESYANGYAERLISMAIKETTREKLFITSKVHAENQGYDGTINACKRSLERLETPYLDLYLLHRYNPDFSLKDSINALNDLVKDGLIKYIGVSNFGVERFKEAQGHANTPIVCNQVHYNLKIREPETSGLLKYCQENGVMLVAYRPLEKGAMLNSVPSIVLDMCKKYDKTPAQIAINWLTSQENVVTLSKTSTLDNLEENLGGIGWNLSKEDVEKIREEFPGQLAISDVLALG